MNSTGKRVFRSIILTCMLCHTGLFSQNNSDAIRITDNLKGFGARAIGMGGAYLGVADDYSAIYWNPAGLAQMRKMELMLGLSHVNLDNDVEFITNSSTISNSATKFNSIGLAFPVPTYRGSLVFALGYQRIKDFEYANEFSGISDQGTDRLSFSGVDPDNPDAVYDFWGKDVQKEGFITDGGSLNQWSAAGAVDVSPNVSVGLSLNLWTGSSQYFQDFLQKDVLGNFDIFPADFDEYFENRTISSEFSSFNIKFGTLIRMKKLARLGIGIDLPHTITVKEDFNLDSRLRFDDGFEDEFEEFDEDQSGVFEYDVKQPFRFSGGLSVNLINFLLSGSAEYTDWSQIKFDTSELLDLNKNFKTDYRATIRWRIGGEVGLPFLASQFRAGFVLDPTPLKDQSSDFNRKYVSFGFGILIDKIFKIDLTYLTGYWKQFTADDLSPEGTLEDIQFQNFILTLSLRY